jgi:hypothetical protein
MKPNRKATLKLIKTKLPKVKHKDKMINEIREKRSLTYQKITIRLAVCSKQKPCKPEGSGMIL